MNYIIKVTFLDSGHLFPGHTSTETLYYHKVDTATITEWTLLRNLWWFVSTRIISNNLHVVIVHLYHSGIATQDNWWLACCHNNLTLSSESYETILFFHCCSACSITTVLNKTKLQIEIPSQSWLSSKKWPYIIANNIDVTVVFVVILYIEVYKVIQSKQEAIEILSLKEHGPLEINICNSYHLAQFFHYLTACRTEQNF